jgi:hypothetical protein
MEISKIKDNGLQIKTKSATLVVDCFDETEKLSPEADKADFGLSSRPFLKTHQLDVDKRVFSWPGEYEVKGVAVHAHPVAEITDKKTPDMLFVIYTEQFKVCYLPVLTKQLHSDLIEQIGDVDLLIFTVAGDEKILQSTIEEIEPKSIMPLRSAANPHAVDLFVQKLALETRQEDGKVTFKGKADFSNEKMLAFLLG